VFGRVFFTDKPQLRQPVLIEGLPGIGYVANIVALHLISELKAKKFCEIYSPSFQAFSLISREGGIHYPINELYYGSPNSMEKDLIILFGNSQAGDPKGQYRLGNQILDIAQNLGCGFVLTIGGLRREMAPAESRVFCAATDAKTMRAAQGLGAQVMQGQIFGMAGLLLGLAKMRKMSGLCILSETSGLFADVAAARSALQFMCKFLGLNVDYSRLDQAVEANKRILDSFSESTPPAKRRYPSTI